jgi:hypothetical protein
MFEPDEITARVRRLRVVWAAMLMSVALFTAVVWYLIARGGVRGAPDLDPVLLGTLAVIVALGLLIAPMVRRRLEAIPRVALNDEIVRRWEHGWLVSQAIKEGVGLAGLVIALLAGSPSWALGFAVASLGSMVMTPPWEHELRLRLHRADPSGGAQPPY